VGDRCLYPVRGLTGGYILSPAARARVLSCIFTPGSRTHRGYILSPAARARASGRGTRRKLECRSGPSVGGRCLYPVRGLTGG
ncbi:MAG TPA: hypothetical protein VKM94_06740, partial [Blastocatellia bacterium]|nr:hypothetical protein [Blastocatellia bacterium]